MLESKGNFEKLIIKEHTWINDIINKIYIVYWYQIDRPPFKFDNGSDD